MDDYEEITLEEVIALQPEQVKAGANWLDQVHPGWDEKVNLETLDINSCKDCVIGQLLGNYCGNSKLHVTVIESGSQLGFCTPSIEADDEDGEAMTALTLTWKELIEARR